MTTPRHLKNFLLLTLLLLALQFAALLYSFTYRATWFSHVGPEMVQPGHYIGVNKARWFWLHLAPNWPHATTNPAIPSRPTVIADHIGIRYTFRPDFVIILTIHFAWTLIPNLILIAIPASRLLAIRRARRRVLFGLCSHCGYDLRATSARCPECGHPLHPDSPYFTNSSAPPASNPSVPNS